MHKAIVCASLVAVGLLGGAGCSSGLPDIPNDGGGQITDPASGDSSAGSDATTPDARFGDSGAGVGSSSGSSSGLGSGGGSGSGSGGSSGASSGGSSSGSSGGSGSSSGSGSGAVSSADASSNADSAPKADASDGGLGGPDVMDSGPRVVDSGNGSDSSLPDAALTSAPSLGSLVTFSVLGASTVTCTNLSALAGDVGVSPGTAITGFDPSCTTAGTIHAGDAAAALAHADLAVAYGALTAVVCEHNLTGQDLGGQTLAPGVYCFDTAAGLTGALTLDGGGDGNATWIFQIGTAIVTGSSSSVVTAGSGKSGNVFWRVGSSATISMGTAFQGNILASASVTLVSGSNLSGRALSLNAAVTSDDNAISMPR